MGNADVVHRRAPHRWPQACSKLLSRVASWSNRDASPSFRLRPRSRPSASASRGRPSSSAAAAAAAAAVLQHRVDAPKTALTSAAAQVLHVALQWPARPGRACAPAHRRLGAGSVGHPGAARRRWRVVDGRLRVNRVPRRRTRRRSARTRPTCWSCRR